MTWTLPNVILIWRLIFEKNPSHLTRQIAEVQIFQINGGRSMYFDKKLDDIETTFWD